MEDAEKGGPGVAAGHLNSKISTALLNIVDVDQMAQTTGINGNSSYGTLTKLNPFGGNTATGSNRCGRRKFKEFSRTTLHIGR